ncbi:RNA polymerase-associated protein rapA [Candidatus Thioglobus sp.]|nr:RNA polymerase-associated protein rapA [Candidatus Thioglobus sp.]
MKKQNLILSAALAAVFSASTAFAEAEVTGKIVHESAKFTTTGTTIGAATAHDKDVFKQETSARIYIDGEADTLQEGATYHVELNLMRDSKAVGDYDSNESYTQRDALREAYVDAEINGYSIRAGKQQVVWGTADGMKLLDAINPTDYAEMAQNQMEDSRIPVWMVNTEADSTDGGNWQFIVSEGKSSHFAGMGNSSSTALSAAAIGGPATANSAVTTHKNGDTGNAFIMKGADTITGEKNGFLNVAMGLGAVSQAFDRGAQTNDMDNNGTDDGNGYFYVSLAGYTKASVNDFAINKNVAGEGGGGLNQSIGFKGFCDNTNTGAQCLSDITNDLMAPNNLNFGANNQNGQNLMSDQTNAEWTANLENPTEMFHYMPDATFATFDAFVNMKTKYVVDHNSTPTTALRYKNTTKDGVNYSINAIRGNDTNPYVHMEWQDNNGVVLTETAVSATDSVQGVTYVTNQLRAPGATSNSVGGGTVIGTTGDVSVDYSANNAGTATNVANLVMTEKLNTMTQLGGSFDTAIETEQLGPIVLRGEALYQKDVMSPVVTRKDSTGQDLNHGFLVSAVEMQKGDRFKYVLGADITAMTNMLVSVQFIQDMNLDYVDVGNKDATNWKYTADMATMHLTNNLNQAEENKEFYSLFFSKPFGASGEHRWNNITMYEENGGKWNRLDAEFSIDDDTQATVEYNKYWGNENTQFGQLEKSSNIQVGVKYSF